MDILIYTLIGALIGASLGSLLANIAIEYNKDTRIYKYEYKELGSIEWVACKEWDMCSYILDKKYETRSFKE